MRSFSGSTDSSKWNWPSSHWNTLKTISLTWACTADQSSWGESAPDLDEGPALAPPLRERPHRGLVLLARDLAARAAAPRRRRSVGRLLVANTTRPALR